MTNKEIAEKIKDHLVELAIGDKLPMDMTEFDIEPVIEILNQAEELNKVSDGIGYYLSNDVDEHEKIIAYLRKAISIIPDELVDGLCYSEGEEDDEERINVWEPLGGRYTVREFCDLIGI